MQFKDVLKNLRNQRDISQAELAKELGLTQKTIALYETGRREPSYANLQKLKDYFHVSEDYLSGKDIENISYEEEYRSNSEKIFYNYVCELKEYLSTKNTADQSLILDSISIAIHLLTLEDTTPEYYDLCCALLAEWQRYEDAIEKGQPVHDAIDIYHKYSSSISAILLEFLKLRI